MKVFVDQSGKVEDTSKPTVVAFTNKERFVVKIRPKVKRQLQEIFRRRGKTRLFIYRTFSALIFLLIKDFLPKIDQVIIDLEYPGQERLIKDILLELIRKEKLREPEIYFKRIGNRPKVHYLAYNVYSGEKKENKEVKLEDLLKLTIKK
jgi:hypothetical protein